MESSDVTVASSGCDCELDAPIIQSKKWGEVTKKNTRVIDKQYIHKRNYGVVNTSS